MPSRRSGRVTQCLMRRRLRCSKVQRCKANGKGATADGFKSRKQHDDKCRQISVRKSPTLLFAEHDERGIADLYSRSAGWRAVAQSRI